MLIEGTRWWFTLMYFSSSETSSSFLNVHKATVITCSFSSSHEYTPASRLLLSGFTFESSWISIETHWNPFYIQDILYMRMRERRWCGAVVWLSRVPIGWWETNGIDSMKNGWCFFNWAPINNESIFLDPLDSIFDRFERKNLDREKCFFRHE